MEVVKQGANKSPILMIYGTEGRGKTTLASKFKGAVWFPLEAGLPRGVEVDAIRGIDSFEGIMAALRDLFADPKGYQTLVVDTVDMLEAHLIEYVCAKYHWENIEKPPYGKGYVAADDEWRRFIRAITAIRDKHGLAIVLVCHSTIERVDDPRAPSYTSYQPRLHKRARALMMDACDLIGFLAEDLRVITDSGGFQERTRAAAGAQRYLFVEGTPAFAAKNRFAAPAKIAVPLDFDIATLTQYWA
jgi:AAA domain